MHRIALLGRPLPWIVDRVRERYTPLLREEDEPADGFLDRASDAEAIICFGGGHVDGPLLDRLGKVRAVVNFGAGYDRIDVAAARARGVAVAYLPGVTAGCVADHAMALMLAACRGVVAGHRFVEEGEWVERRFPLSRRFSGRRLGIYGLGRIGREVARRAAAFDMEIGYHSRRERADVPHRYFGELSLLAGWADILLVACPLDESTRASVDARILATIGPDGLLVNIARGAIVDEAALVKALDAGLLGGAALDVVETEPSVPTHLTGRPNVVLTPHIGGGTVETWRDTVDRMIANVDAFFATGAVLDPIPG